MSGIDEAHRALVTAQGKALTILAMMLNRSGAIDALEYGKLLGSFAVLTTDDCGIERDILAIWSDIVMQSAQDSAQAPNAEQSRSAH